MLVSANAPILVTGGLGFIGSHVAHTLIQQGYHVTVLDDLSTGKEARLPKGARLVIGDVADTDLVQELVNNAHAVIHLAAVASVEACRKNRPKAHQTNAFGTLNLFEASARSSRRPRVIYASSAAIYGEQQQLPIKESAAAAPLSAYGLDKWFAEKEAALAYAHAGINSVGLRFFNVYGPWQDPSSAYSGVISLFAKAMLEDRPITIFGDGEQTRDFIYVGDVVTLILAALKAKEGAHYLNGCTGHGTSILLLEETLRHITRSNSMIHHGTPREEDIRHSVGDASRAHALLRFKAKTTLQEGLTALIEWMRQT